MLNIKPETLAQMDDKELEARKVDAEKLDNRVKAQFSLKGLLGWALGGAAIGATLAFFALPLMAVVLPVAAAIAIVPPAASYAATFYTHAELKRITDTIAERKAPKQKLEVIFEDGTRSTINARSSSLSPTFSAKSPPPASVESVTEALTGNKPMLLLAAPPKAA